MSLFRSQAGILNLISLPTAPVALGDILVFGSILVIVSISDDYEWQQLSSLAAAPSHSRYLADLFLDTAASHLRYLADVIFT